MKILICDIHVRLEGHNLGYVQNILRYLEETPSANEYIFLFNPSAKALPSVRTSAPNCRITFFTEEEFAPYESGEDIKTATLKVWKHIEKYAMKYGAEKLLILQMDMFQHTIGLSKLTLPISGILLTPLTRIAPSNEAFSERVKFGIRYLKKALTTFLLLRNKHIEHIFLLNDSESVAQLNTKFGTKVFTYLPDPVYDYPFDETLDCRGKYQISPKRIIFLSFGMIDEKKNVVNIIKAASELSPQIVERLCILIVGKVRNTYEQALSEAIAEANRVQPVLQIVQESRFVTDAEMESYVRQSDCISLAYINFYSSSGVIGLAARHNKPILATQLGVVGKQTTNYGLGVTTDARDVKAIKNALENLLQNIADYPQNAGGYVAAHSPRAFMQQLLF